MVYNDYNLIKYSLIKLEYRLKVNAISKNKSYWPTNEEREELRRLEGTSIIDFVKSIYQYNWSQFIIIFNYMKYFYVHIL